MLKDEPSEAVEQKIITISKVNKYHVSFFMNYRFCKNLASNNFYFILFNNFHFCEIITTVEYLKI